MKFVPLAVILITSILASNTVHAQIQCGNVQRQRRSWRAMSCNERNTYLRAVQDLKSLSATNNLQIPNYDAFVLVHQQNELDAHGLDAFLPWHRWFIYQFETALQIVALDCSIALPYWDWEVDAFDTTSSKVLEPLTFGSVNGIAPNSNCVTEGIARWDGIFGQSVTDNGCIQREFDTGRTFVDESGVLDIIVNSQSFSEFRQRLEATPHGAPHNFVGGFMETMLSPDDPLFFVHHCNVDRLWSIYQDYQQHDTIANPNQLTFTEVGDETFLPFGGSNYNGFFFNNGNNYPTARQLHYIDGTTGLVNTRYLQDGLGFTLNQIINNYGMTLNNNDWIEIGTSVVVTNNANCGDFNIIPTAQPVFIPVPTPAPQDIISPRVCLQHNGECISDIDCCSGTCWDWGDPWFTLCYGDGPEVPIGETPAPIVVPNPTPQPILIPNPTPQPIPESTVCLQHNGECTAETDCCSGVCRDWGDFWGTLCFGDGVQQGLPTPAPIMTPAPIFTPNVCGIHNDPCIINEECCSGTCWDWGGFWGTLCYGGRRRRTSERQSLRQQVLPSSTTRTTSDKEETVLLQPKPATTTTTPTEDNDEEDVVQQDNALLPDAAERNATSLPISLQRLLQTRVRIFFAEELNERWYALLVLAATQGPQPFFPPAPPAPPPPPGSPPGISVPQVGVSNSLLQTLRNEACDIRDAPDVLVSDEWIEMQNMQDVDISEFQCQRN